MKNLFFTFLIAFFGFLGACNQKSGRVADELEGIVRDNSFSDDLAFEIIPPYNPFPDAILEMYAPLYNQKFKPGKIPFEFNIVNYPLGRIGQNHKLLLILNGGNPLSFETPIFNLELKEGAYRAVSYLVDEKGRMLKDFGNYVDRDFRVGETGAFPYATEPYLAINLPLNGEVFTKENEIIIDFLVLGGDLKEDGLIVKIQVGNQSFETEEITPVQIKNLPKGEHQIIISLLRKGGEELLGAFSSISKTIIIE